MTTPSPRTTERRIQDTRDRLASDVDAWVATADPASGAPGLVLLSFLWDGATLLVSTPTASRTGRNLASSGVASLGVGPTRDVVLLEGTVEAIPDTELPADLGDAFAARTGFDPRAEPNEYTYFRVTPRRVQAWREADEQPGRTIMRDGRWLAG